MLGFAIGAEEQERVSIEIVGGHAEAQIQWLRASVAVRAGGFTGHFDTDFIANDISRFLGELRELYRTLQGSACFTSWDKQIELKLEGNGRGGVGLLGEAMDIAGTGNRLRFHLDIDQTYLPTLVSDLEQICAEYPERVA
jgi:hypothetical protein